MSLKPHKDMIKQRKKNKGYAIRVGNAVPKNSTNLAYVHSNPVTPEDNILLEDVSSKIKENGLSTFVETDYLVYPDNSYRLETESGQSVFPISTVSITDEFTIKENRQDTPKPVFYKMELSGRFDVRNAQVLPYKGGYSSLNKQEAVAFEDIYPGDRSELIYAGDAIRIESEQGLLDKDKHYKIQLVQEEGFIYRVIILTSFKNNKSFTHTVSYPEYDKQIKESRTKEEILKAYPYFDQVTAAQFREITSKIEANPDQYKDLKVYTIKEENNQYSFYATSDLMIANYQTRKPQTFKHRVEANLSTRISETNNGEINIGYVFVQEVAFVENVKSIGKTIYESQFAPSYLTIQNPHPKEHDLLKQDIRYWEVDLDMPVHHFEDYDIIFIAGYGKIDLSTYREKLNAFAENGGTLFIDNLGSGSNVLDFKINAKNTFVADISFSSSTNEFGIREAVSQTPYTRRLYNITDTSKIGYPNVAAKIVYGPNEYRDEWTTVLSHKGGGPSLIKKSFLSKGQIIVSNAGLLRGAYHSNEQNLHLLMNTLIHHAENQWVFTPWRNDFVYNRENLFQEEYKSNHNDIYVNERSDYDANKIVAKKRLHPNIKEYVRTFAQPWLYDATGYYIHNVDGDKDVLLNNNEFESGRIQENGDAITEWTNTKINAIPAWSTNRLAGKDTVFNHNDGESLFGVRDVSLSVIDSSVGAQSFWESEPIFLSKDDYSISAWIGTSKVSGITSDGARVGIYSEDGKMIAKSVFVRGNVNRTKVKADFHINESELVRIRLGFIDGNGSGTVRFDNVKLNLVGNVRGVLDNEGQKPLYAFSTQPNASTIDIEAEGFGDANITRIAPTVPFSYSITPFIYQWLSYGMSDETGKDVGTYERMYGNPVTTKVDITKNDGLINLGYLHTLLPAIPSGRRWYDKNKVFYHIALGGYDAPENELINLKLLDRKTGSEWYSNEELVIGFKDIFWATTDPSFVLHAQTEFETIRATKRSFGLKLVDDEKIYCEIPQTKDTKENWYLKLHNGKFTKDTLEYNEWFALSREHTAIEKYKERVMKKENYSIKEYMQQLFDPSIGLMRVENEFEYLTPTKIKAAHSNLFVEKGSVIMEELIVEGGSGKKDTSFRGRRRHWLRNANLKVYIDESNNGNKVQIFEEYPYEINHQTGMITFPNKVIMGKVYATYDYQNFHIYKRLYKNRRISNEVLRNKRTDSSTGETVMYGTQNNWLIEPAPILKTSASRLTTENIVDPTNYQINYKEGSVHFSYDPQQSIYIDYGYYEKQELDVRDFDVENGIFILNENISFKDDIFGEYTYYEDFYEYKGFYDQTLKAFLHLDLNPSVGHYTTLPQTVYVDGSKVVEYQKSSSSQLLNKIIHIYIVPESETGVSIRHCFSAAEWRNIQISNPMYLLIAKIQVRENSTVNDVVIMDARSQGGGLSESLSSKDIEQQVKGKQRYWDIGSWDGKAFYKNGVLIVNIPKEILKEYGGTLNERYVRDAIEKHIAFGTYYILEWR